MSASQTQERSFVDLFRNLRDESTTLLRQEVALAKTEMSEKVAKVGRNVAYAMIGGAIAHLALIFLLLSATGAIELGVDQTEVREHSDWIAPLIVGLVIGLIAALLVVKAIKSLSNMTLAPEQTIQSIKEDKQWVQNKVA